MASWNFHSHNLFTAGWNQTIPYNKLFWVGSWPSYGVQKGPIYGTTTDLYTKLNSFKWLTISIYPDFVCQVHCTRGKGTCFIHGEPFYTYSTGMINIWNKCLYKEGIISICMMQDYVFKTACLYMIKCLYCKKEWDIKAKL